MRLFYLSEHRSCFNYQLRYESGFSRYELTAHEEGRIDNDGCFCVLFGHHPGRMPPAVLEQGNNGVRQDVFRFHFS